MVGMSLSRSQTHSSLCKAVVIYSIIQRLLLHDLCMKRVELDDIEATTTCEDSDMSSISFDPCVCTQVDSVAPFSVDFGLR